MQKSAVMVSILASFLGVAVVTGVLYMQVIPALQETLIQQPQGPAAPPASTPKNWDFWTLEIGALSEELLKEKQALKEKVKDMEIWHKQLLTEKADLERVRKQIEAMREEIDKSVVTLMESEKPNLKSLSRSYASMKPAQVVTIFQKTNDDIAVKILSLMKPEMVAKILTEMSAQPKDPKAPPDEISGSERAARITETLRLLKQENSKKESE